MTLKNIHLFRWQNGLLLSDTIIAWKDKFIQKYGEMNLAEIRKQDLYDSILSDCISPGFMGMTRMIVFRDLIIKTDREISDLQEKEDQIVDENSEEKSQNKQKSFDDQLWIETLKIAPETNFFLFVGNKTPVTDLEKWIAENATIHDFSLPNPDEISTLIVQSLWVSNWQASRIQERLNHNYYFIYQEIQKLKLAEKTSWTDEELKEVLPNYFEESNFNILNPLWKKNVSDLLYTFRDTLRTADRELTMAMLTTMLRKVLIASFLPSESSLRALPAIKSSQINTAQRIGRDREILKKLYDAIVTIDTDEKQWESTGKLDAFLMALLSYCAAPETL